MGEFRAFSTTRYAARSSEQSGCREQDAVRDVYTGVGAIPRVLCSPL